jgi:hypothetical protein
MFFAKIMAKSKTINIVFRDDLETCFMLCMQADQWNLQPDFVAANSFYDDYGRLSQTGKLLKMVMLNNTHVDKLEAVYSGDWDVVKNQFTVESDGIPYPKWDAAVETDLMLEIKVLLSTGETVTESITMGSIDPTLRSFNSAWTTKPYNQIYNHVIRTLAFGKLSHLVHCTDTIEAEEEQNAAKRIRNNKTTPKSSQPDSQPEQATDPIETKVILSEQAQTLIDETPSLRENLESTYLDMEIKEECLGDWVNKVQKYATNKDCTDVDKHELSAAYDHLVILIKQKEAA